MGDKTESRASHLVSEIKTVASITPGIKFFTVFDELDHAVISVYIRNPRIREIICQNLTEQEVAENTAFSEGYYQQLAKREREEMCSGPATVCMDCGKIICEGETRVPNHDARIQGVRCSDCHAKDFESFMKGNNHPIDDDNDDDPDNDN